MSESSASFDAFETRAKSQAGQQPVPIKVLGIGGAGCNALSHLAREPLAGVTFAALNTDAAALAHTNVETKLVLGLQTTRGLGAGSDPERGQAAAEEDLASIRALCEGAKVVFVVAGLGGGTGTGGGPVLARVAKDAGALVFGIVILPFDCEGARRLRQAQLGLYEFKKAADGVICLPNQKVLKAIDEHTSLLEAFTITNEFVAQGIRGIWRLLSKPGLINADFADLCSVTQGLHTESMLATAEAKGENRLREIIEKLMAHPLIEDGQALADAAGLLVSIQGGPDLTMAEVNRILEQLNRHCEQAHIILGAAIDPGMADRLSVTIVAGRRHSGFADEDISPAAERNAPRFSEPPARSTEDSEQERNSPGSLKNHPRFSGPSAEWPDQRIPSPAGGRHRKNPPRLRQGQLPLEIVSKGRFEKSEPTIHQGQDLDVPTYIRRGVALN